MIARNIEQAQSQEKKNAHWITGVVAHVQNGSGAMTVIDPTSNATYHLVEYGSPTLRERARQLPQEAPVEVCLTRAGFRANVWRAEAIYRGTQ